MFESRTCCKWLVDSRWNLYFATLVNFILMYNSVTGVLEMLKEEVSVKDARGEANGLILLMDNFSFALMLLLMKNDLDISNELLDALQKKDQDITNG